MASNDPSLAHQYKPPSYFHLPAYHPSSDVPPYGGNGNHNRLNGSGSDPMEGGIAFPGDRSAGGSPSMSIGSAGALTGALTGGHLAETAHNYQQNLPQDAQQQYQHPAHPGLAAGNGNVSKPIRRRMRMITSCLECRRRKLKCNKSNPCTNCVKFSRDCLYLGPKLDEASQLRLTEIKEKVGSLERQLERDVANSGSRGFYQQRILADDVEGEFDEERDLEITPMVALDLTYEDDADGTDDIMDLGVQVGKMRLTEKIGGMNRPRISEEVCHSELCPGRLSLMCPLSLLLEREAANILPTEVPRKSLLLGVQKTDRHIRSKLACLAEYCKQVQDLFH